MRKILFGVLLAGAAAPAFAAGGPGIHFRQDDNSSREQSRSERPARDDRESRPAPPRPANVERPHFDGGNMQRPQFVGGDDRPQVQRPQFGGGYGRPDRAQVDHRPAGDGDRRAPPVFRDNPYARSPQDARNWQHRDNDDRGRYSRDGIHFHQPGVGDVPRPGTQPPIRVGDRRGPGIHWNRDWRNDHRWDWRDRRRHHGSLFHIGVYYDPFGWSYRPLSIGWRMWPNYYQQNYWIDPGMYGLPYPPPGTQWVRYWNDALLVDMYSGEVVDVINNFFW